MPEPSPELVRRAQSGEEAALVELVQSQQTYVHSIALRVMRNAPDAADMTQEAFVRLLRVLPSFRGETKFTTWLYRLVTNVCLDGLRRAGRRASSLDEVEDDEQSLAATLRDDDPWVQPDTTMDRREVAAQVRMAIDSLPVSQRLALTLLYFEDQKYEEIATTMGLPVNTVKSHIRRGKERLANLLPTFHNEASESHAVQRGN
jgi:RNA polymerase sigma-70 factor (ECF subfamily)